MNTLPWDSSGGAEPLPTTEPAEKRTDDDEDVASLQNYSALRSLDVAEAGELTADAPESRSKFRAWLADHPLAVRRVTDAAVLLLLTLLVSTLVISTGNLETGPRFVDDNQIFKLSHDMWEQGFFVVVQEHFQDRTERLGRFVPAYLTYKLLATLFIGTRLVVWSILTMAIGIAGAFFLYLFGRELKLNAIEAAALALIAVLGEQSVLWWRLLHGEGLGLLFLAIGMYCLVKGIKSGYIFGRWDRAFLLFTILASLSKESFILVIPAVCFMRVWLHTLERKISVRSALKADARVVTILLVVAAAELLYIKFGIRRTHFGYTGWKGFDANNLYAIALDFFSGYRLWMLLTACVFVVIGIGATRAFLRIEDRISKRVVGNFVVLVVLLGLFVGPQLLLYMSSGFSGRDSVDMARYLVPATLGIALVITFSLKLLREWLQENAPTERLRACRRLLLYPAYGLLVTALLLQTRVAAAEATEFAERTAIRNQVFNNIDGRTTEEATLLVAYNQSNSGSVRRFAILLQEYLGRTNVYYVPVAQGTALTDFAVEWQEPDGFAELIEQRTVADPSGLSRLRAIIFPDGADLETAFAAQNRYWFDPLDYRRIRTELGDVMYFYEPKGRRSVSDLALSTAIQIREWELNDDGTMTLAGFASADTAIDRVGLVIGGRSLDAVEFPAGRFADVDDSVRAGPARQGMFEVTFPYVGDMYGEPARVTLFTERTLIALANFPASYTLPTDIDPEVRANILRPVKESFPPLLEVSRSTDKSVLRGWALAADPITDIEVYVDGEELPDVEMDQERRDIYDAYPEYLDLNSGFSVDVPMSPKYVGKPITVRVLSGDEILIEREFKGILPLPLEWYQGK